MKIRLILIALIAISFTACTKSELIEPSSATTNINSKVLDPIGHSPADSIKVGDTGPAILYTPITGVK